MLKSPILRDLTEDESAQLRAEIFSLLDQQQAEKKQIGRIRARLRKKHLRLVIQRNGYFAVCMTTTLCKTVTETLDEMEAWALCWRPTKMAS